MKKFIKRTDIILSVFCILFFAFMFSGDYILPDKVVFYDGQQSVRIMSVFTAEKNKSVEIENVENNSNESAKISLFGVLPVATVSATETTRQYVYVGGNLVGIRLYTDGILVVGTDSVDSPDGVISPAEECGIKKGDILTAVGEKKIDSVSGFIGYINASEGDGISVTVMRDGKELKVNLKPAFSVTENKYRCGLWLRDSTAGIGTMTFADPTEKVIASLGHAICDSETGSILPVGEGDILCADINGCIKGTKGATGQIKGNFASETIGELSANNEYGVYGTYTYASFDEDMLYPVASQTEIRTGKAQIISTVTPDGAEFYDAEIERITYSEDKSVRSMVIKITDEELIGITGGIIQGMSGSPIIQNGMLVGAVTHVFLNDPTRGYGIFAETMISVGKTVSEEKNSR